MVLKRARHLPQCGREALLTAVSTRMYFGCREKQQDQGDTRKRSFGIECLMKKAWGKVGFMATEEKEVSEEIRRSVAVSEEAGNKKEEFRRAGKWLKWRSLGFFLMGKK